MNKLNKQNRDKLIDRELADSSGHGEGGKRGLGSRRIKQQRKRTHTEGQQCGDCRGGAWVEVAEGTRGMNGSETSTVAHKPLK